MPKLGQDDKNGIFSRMCFKQDFDCSWQVGWFLDGSVSFDSGAATNKFVASIARFVNKQVSHHCPDTPGLPMEDPFYTPLGPQNLAVGGPKINSGWNKNLRGKRKEANEPRRHSVKRPPRHPFDTCAQTWETQKDTVTYLPTVVFFSLF